MHFNWIALTAEPGSPAGFDLTALAGLHVKAQREGLSMMVDCDFGGVAAAHRLAFEEDLPALARVVDGIRAIGAHRFPIAGWRKLMERTPGLIWVADTLGAGSSDTARVLEAGFAFYLSSVKWWNTDQDWALEQHARLRRHGGSIGFPENLGGTRLRTELSQAGLDQDVRGLYGVRYALAAFFGSGVMMPLGYERASEAALQDGGSPASGGEIDLGPVVTAVNRMKAAHPPFAGEMAQRRLPIADVLAMVKLDDAGSPLGCFLCNVHPRGVSVSLERAARRGGIALDALRDVTPASQPRIIERPFWLAPHEWRLFVRPPTPEAGDADRSGARQMRADGRRLVSSGRIVIEGVVPEIDCGRFAVKRVVGDRLQVSADIYRDGHEVCAASLLLRAADEPNWMAVPMLPHENDRWFAAAELPRNGLYHYCIEAWRDCYASWLRGTAAKYDAGQEIAVELSEGRRLVAAAAQRATGQARCALLHASTSPPADAPLAAQFDRLSSAEVQAAMAQLGARTDLTRYTRQLEVVVDRKTACFAAWYEMFPRSQGTAAGRSASFADCMARLDDVAAMGFSVVYLPPIHPIGRTNRKGRNNALVASPDEPGSPYAIGGTDGGHDAIEPGLGTLDDFRAFVAACRARHLEVALDFAVQCSPDHPWIREHPEWFEFRPDGSIRFAENPPKKYQDIVSLNLRGDGPIELWHALRDIVLFWIEQGVSIFRVDNPHTKPFPFWAWLIREVQRQKPEVIFLAEAFTRPKPLRHLAKLGFSQSYTYFTWRNTKQELVDYFTELTQTDAREYLRPHLFTNTPDILPVFLQRGGPAAFRIRAALAATLSSLFGIYNGFELCEAKALPNSEEYLDSEKYQYKVWDWDRPGHIKEFIAALNRVRLRNPALHDWRNLTFLSCDSDRVLFFAKWAPAGAVDVFVAVSLDPYAPVTVGLDLPLDHLEIRDGERVDAEDLLHGGRRSWSGRRQQVTLSPEQPIFLFSIDAASRRSV